MFTGTRVPEGRWQWRNAPAAGSMRPEIRLVRRGFTDPGAALRLLAGPGLGALADDPVLLDALGATADPDLALLGLARLLEALDAAEQQTLRDTLTTSKPLRDRLLGVLGASAALADHLARHPRDWHALVTFEQQDMHPGSEDFLRALYDGVWGGGREGVAGPARGPRRPAAGRLPALPAGDRRPRPHRHHGPRTDRRRTRRPGRLHPADRPGHRGRGGPAGRARLAGSP